MTFFDKNQLRAEAIVRRKNLVLDRAEVAMRLEAQFQTHISYNNIGGNLAFYWPLPSEADPRLIALKYIDEHGGNCCLPAPDNSKREMDFYAWSKDTDLIKGAGGIDMPDVSSSSIVMPDTLLVPLLVINQDGQRIGFGKGNYDATLRALRRLKPVKAIGVAFDEQYYSAKWEYDQYDEKLDALITPSQYIEF